MNKEIEYSEDSYSKFDMKVINFIKMIENTKNNGIITNIPDPTPLRISTRSAISSISSKILLDKMGIVLIKNIAKNILDNRNNDYLIKGICMKSIALITIKKKNKHKKSNVTLENLDEMLKLLQNEKREHFYNSCTIIVKPDLERRPVNIKLFSNGSISMTGCLNNEDGYDAVNVLLDELKKYPFVFGYDKNSIELKQKLDDIKILSYNIIMINSDYKLNFKIDRIKLFNILLKTNILVMYDPENYPGVKIYYYWNMFNGENDGVCKCKDKKKCNGKGNGYGEGDCKKVTIAIFQSGSVIITGARNEMQIYHVYEKINEIIKNNYNNVIKFSILDCLEENNEIPPDESYLNEVKKPVIIRKKLRIKKKKIKNN